MPNEAKIRETLAVARENQHRLDMNHWAHGQVNPNAASWQECGVTFCLAGWRAALDGLRPQIGPYGRATGDFIDSDGFIWREGDWAVRSMELDSRQAYDLFVATAGVTNIDVLDWIAEQIIAGHSLGECLECDGSGVRIETGEPCKFCAGRGFVIEVTDLEVPE